MAEVVKKQYKSKYHILIWIVGLSLLLMGLIEYGYFVIGRAFGVWKIHLGLIPYAAWLVLTYIATKPKWFMDRYNPVEMFDVHRIVGVVSVVLVCAHWYVYFLKAYNLTFAFWTGYISTAAMLIALVFGVLQLSSWLGDRAKSVSRKKALWIHRLNLVAIVAANLHVHGFGRISKMVPFMTVLDVLTYGLVMYYIYWMLKQK
jgi:putative membrane protein